MALFLGCESENPVSDPPPREEPEVPEEPPPSLSDEELMGLVQERTFNYFWDFAEEQSGMALERSNGSNTVVTTGGSGFGIASFPTAVERGWVSEAEAIQRLQKILDFLEEVPTYHGAFAHWYNGSTGETVPFSEFDNGGDLVETSFLMQGLLINRQYFDDDTQAQNDIRQRITTLIENVEWTWYTQGENVLYWHWSPEYDFQINLQINGYNEALITYVLAASSPTYSIEPEVYHQGWAGNGSITNGETYYDETLPLGNEMGGPLFFAHYSFIGLNPEGLSDRYADYWEQNRSHTLINYNYCVDNPLGYRGYGEDVWGLTASDGPNGYSAHSPTNDLGVITPTAAISSIPYTPDRSLNAMHYFYDDLGNRLWGDYGFYDAFSLQEQWFSGNYLAIDQGPIVAMIENYRTGLLWDLFMNDPDVQNGLEKLDFSSPYLQKRVSKIKEPTFLIEESALF